MNASSIPAAWRTIDGVAPCAIVSPRAPRIRLRTPASGGRTPERRFTCQTPSSSATKGDRHRGSVPGTVYRQPPIDADRPAEVGLEIRDLHDVAHRPRPL